MVMAIPKSSNDAISAVAQTWRIMVDAVNEHKVGSGRGVIYHEEGTDELHYVSLFDLQRDGGGEFGLDDATYSQLLRVIGSGYDFRNEFVLLVKQRHGETIKWVVQTGELRYEGWRGVKTEKEIKAQEQADQLAIARPLRDVFREGRKAKSKRKRKRR